MSKGVRATPNRPKPAKASKGPASKPGTIRIPKGFSGHPICPYCHVVMKSTSVDWGVDDVQTPCQNCHEMVTMSSLRSVQAVWSTETKEWTCGICDNTLFIEGDAPASKDCPECGQVNDLPKARTRS